jgi:hypothetical protein
LGDELRRNLQAATEAQAAAHGCQGLIFPRGLDLVVSLEEAFLHSRRRVALQDFDLGQFVRQRSFLLA